MFVYKFGVAKLQCCLLMNGLVFDSNEVLIFFIFIFCFWKSKNKGRDCGGCYQAHQRAWSVVIHAPSTSLKNRVLLLSKDGNQREPWEGERIGERERERERESRPRRAWRKIFHDCNARYKPKFPLSGFSSRGFKPLPEIPFHVFFLFLFCIDWLLRKIYGLVCMDDFQLYTLNDLAKKTSLKLWELRL
jgi:hypothetical protein